MASVIKAGVVASAYVLGRGMPVIVCASRRADINVSILFIVCIDADKSLQASVRALGGSSRHDQEVFCRHDCAASGSPWIWSGDSVNVMKVSMAAYL